MSKVSFTARTLGFFVLTLAFCTMAQAQATRTWVSGVGDDVNPCSRTAPCKTFAGAISKTATGGEISVLDPGGYGTLTVTKAITVDGGTGAGWGSTLFSSVNGFVINITTNLTTDKVILRNLSINGAGTTLGVDGVRFLDGEELTMENISIFNYSGDGLDVNQAQACRVNVRNVTFSHGGVGIKSTSAASAVVMNLNDVRINSMQSHGIQAINNTVVYAQNVKSMRNGIGVGGGDGMRADGTIGSSVINCTDCTVFGNFTTGFNAINSGLIRITNSNVYNHATGIAGNVKSGGNNKFAANTSNGTPTASDITTQ